MELYPPETLRVFGTYLRLRSDQQVPNGAQLRGAVFHNAKTFIDDISPTSFDITDSGWVAEFSLPPQQFDASRSRGFILPYWLSAGRHTYSQQRINFRVVRTLPLAVKPSIDAVKIPAAVNQSPPTQDATREPGTTTYVVNGVNNPTGLFQLEGEFASGTTPDRATDRILLYQVVGTNRARVTNDGAGFEFNATSSTDRWSALLPRNADGDYEYEAVFVQGELETEASERVTVLVRTKGPTIRNQEPANGQVGDGRIQLKLFFDPDTPLDEDTAETNANYEINGQGVSERQTDKNPLSARYDPSDNSVTLTFADYDGDGTYTVTVLGANHTPTPSKPIQDIYGNPLAESQQIRLLRLRQADTPSVTPGITATTGPFVPYQEWTKPRAVPDGFNPHDKVETRVARLYFYRDAHRVAQIVNRKVKSYNRQGVDMARQLADKARRDAESATQQRQAAERAAIAKAEKTRRAERDLQQAEQSLQRSVREVVDYRRANPQATPASDQTLQQLQTLVQSFNSKVEESRSAIFQMRDEEVAANDLVQRLEGQERLAAQDQFRRETAAAHADPDTYAPGVPTSDDPVEQVSVSVIGEGLIQLRGPIKGINTIRTMIDQIDSPVGQVRVSVHSVQINGERQKRMEEVANRVQTYIDHSRFLTVQSAEMLRKAVVQVAARKAQEAGNYAGRLQEDRDKRYLYAFFGQDFIDELHAMDSEFLRTGNKLLSLHSMDVTSLSSALNLMALAKNSTRFEIMHEFENMTATQLPMAEQSYLESGFGCPKKEHFKCKHPCYCLLGHNARFESLRGFFNAEIADDNTMTPLQREFIRLAQIFKSRLVTEMEYKQRITERAIIEERLGNQQEMYRKQREQEREADEKLVEVQQNIEPVVRDVTTAIIDVTAQISQQLKTGQDRYDSYLANQPQRKGRNEATDLVVELTNYLQDTQRIKNGELWLYFELPGAFGVQEGAKVYAEIRKPDRGEPYVTTTPSQPIPEQLKTAEDVVEDNQAIHKYYRAAAHLELRQFEFLKQFRFSERESIKEFRSCGRLANDVGKALDSLFENEQVRTINNTPVVIEKRHLTHLAQLRKSNSYLRERVERSVARLQSQADALIVGLSDPTADYRHLYQRWVGLRRTVDQYVLSESLRRSGSSGAERVDASFRQLFSLVVGLEFAKANVEKSRRPLDHKKFLDMLIDQIEEKYIELLEGTRAHTANIDNYLKRLTTALDDDFNTQFYHPAFRHVREASTFYDVQFGQTETTSVLANNRSFAKVSPKATMEFDLPKRDILLNEALNGAKALMTDVGALATDPTFLAMAKFQNGMSVASPNNGDTNGNSVRSVLPGLNSTTSEQIMSQNAQGGAQFGSNLENLIPDPAIYKFETGTGYEIRPVIQPDGQAVVFDFHYMYTTDMREPVAADEKHLGRVKRHFVDTDVQLSNFELREVSRYTVALKAARTSRGVPLLEDIPLAGALFRPAPSDESSLQQNLIMAQATIFPTLFDLMGLRWAPAIADLDPMRLSNREFVVRGRQKMLQNRVYDYASEQVDKFLQTEPANRRADLYRLQETVPYEHPNGYRGPGLDLRDSQLQENYQPEAVQPQENFIPRRNPNGTLNRPLPPRVPEIRYAPGEQGAASTLPPPRQPDRPATPHFNAPEELQAPVPTSTESSSLRRESSPLRPVSTQQTQQRQLRPLPSPQPREVSNRLQWQATIVPAAPVRLPAADAPPTTREVSSRSPHSPVRAATHPTPPLRPATRRGTPLGPDY